MAIRLLKILAPVIIPFTLFGQSFSVTAKDTLLQFSPGQELLYTVAIVNTSSSPLTLAIKRTEEAMPEGSNSAMCFNICFEPSVDSIATTRTFGSTPLNPAEVRDFSLHVYCGAISGSVVITLTFINMDSTADRRILRFRTITTSVGTVKLPAIPRGVQILNTYPNPFNSISTLQIRLEEEAFVSVKIYTPLGKETADLLHQSMNPGIYSIRWDAAGFPSGVYFCQITASSIRNGSVQNLREGKRLVLIK